MITPVSLVAKISAADAPTPSAQTGFRERRYSSADATSVIVNATRSASWMK